MDRELVNLASFFWGQLDIQPLFVPNDMNSPLHHTMALWSDSQILYPWNGEIGWRTTFRIYFLT